MDLVSHTAHGLGIGVQIRGRDAILQAWRKSGLRTPDRLVTHRRPVCVAPSSRMVIQDHGTRSITSVGAGHVNYVSRRTENVGYYVKTDHVSRLGHIDGSGTRLPNGRI